MTRLFTRAVLAGSGAILGIIGGAIMFAPQTFLATSEVFIDRDPGLISEITAPTGILVLTSLLMMLGAVNARFANAGLISGGIVYGSYGLSRLISMGLHGTPSDTLIVVAGFELAVAALLVGLLSRNTLGTRHHDL